MKLARYVGGGKVEIVDEPRPSLPAGGLVVRTEACGLCSGELMDWYMDRKIPHVLGHETAGVVVESEDGRFPVGARVFAHHHAACMDCDTCNSGHPVHCPQWKRTRLDPGGMAEFFAVGPENLTDTLVVDDLRAVDAALIEPLACVAKSIGKRTTGSAAVIGLGTMGLMHALLLPGSAGFELSPSRREHARSIGIDAREPDHEEKFDRVFVCPGNQSALDFATKIVAVGGTIVLFAPFPPGEKALLDLDGLYFLDVQVSTTYSCGPEDTRRAAAEIRAGRVKAEQVVSHFIRIDELPAAYQAMKRGEILKPMVIFADS